MYTYRIWITACRISQQVRTTCGCWCRKPRKSLWTRSACFRGSRRRLVSSSWESARWAAWWGPWRCWSCRKPTTATNASSSWCTAGGFVSWRSRTSASKLREQISVMIGAISASLPWCSSAPWPGTASLLCTASHWWSQLNEWSSSWAKISYSPPTNGPNFCGALLNKSPLARELHSLITYMSDISY